MSGRQVAGMMLTMTDKVRRLFLTSLALALAILFFSSAVSRAADSVSSSPQTAVFLPPVPAQNQPASVATPVPVQTIPKTIPQTIPMTNAPHGASPVSITSTPAAAAASMTAAPASTPVAATTAAYVTPPASAATPVAPVATAPAAASAPSVSPAAFTVTTPNPQDHLNLDVLRQNHLVDHQGVLEGQRLFKQSSESSVLDPFNWSVMAYKSRYRLNVYYKGRLYTTYHAVFGRSLSSGAKLWEGDRRTPEGAYHIVAKHPSGRFRYFLRIDYPNDVDRVRFAELREDGKIPGRVREGGEIGIHGTDNPILNIGNVNWTTGCISIDNSDIVELALLLPIVTLVVIKP